MTTNTIDPLHYYAQHSIITDPGEYAALLTALPADSRGLRDVVQGLLIHIFWAESYGVKLSDERKSEVNYRAVARQLARLQAITDAPLSQPLPFERRLVGNCRDFSTLLCAMLRQQGIPARPRCGFGTYFMPNHFEDHWVCEVWDSADSRWRLIDAQLDALQISVLQPDFDPLDVPRDQFINGGQAWQMIRAGQANPDHFGIFDMHGWGFVRSNVIQDFMALNKIELLPWDNWGLKVPDPDAAVVEVDLIDTIADLCVNAGTRFAEIRALYARETRLHPDPAWTIDMPLPW